MDSRLRGNDKLNRKKVIIMPQFNRTGPAGAGPRTGRGMGHCGSGMVYGRCGCGCGYGRFGGLYPLQSKLTEKEEAEILNEEAEMLEEDLKGIKGRLSELKK